MKFDGHEVTEAFREAFGCEPSVEQLWFLSKMCKHARLRCRSNAAFNNWMGRCFPKNIFRQVIKKKADGTEYPGLEIL